MARKASKNIRRYQKTRETKKGNYRWRDKDPIMDILRTAIQNSGLVPKEIATAARLTPQTLNNWIHGRTYRPMHYSVAAVMNVLSYRESWRSLEDRIVDAVLDVKPITSNIVDLSRYGYRKDRTDGTENAA